MNKQIHRMAALSVALMLGGAALAWTPSDRERSVVRAPVQPPAADARKSIRLDGDLDASVVAGWQQPLYEHLRASHGLRSRVGMGLAREHR